MTDISDMEVMGAKFRTCPFREGNESPVTDMVKARCLTEASQICHHPKTVGKEETHLCRGAREYQAEHFHRLGLLDEPTLEAWDAKRKELNV